MARPPTGRKRIFFLSYNFLLRVQKESTNLTTHTHDYLIPFVLRRPTKQLRFLGKLPKGTDRLGDEVIFTFNDGEALYLSLSPLNIYIYIHIIFIIFIIFVVRSSLLRYGTKICTLFFTFRIWRHLMYCSCGQCIATYLP